MHKSIYQNEEFARYWNDRAGDTGEVYKRFVLDPIMLKLVGPLQNKSIIELGCGNGYLGKTLVAQDPKRVIMMDISHHNLQFAKEKCDDKRLKFLQQDATQPWHVESQTTDVVYSNMMLNEIEDIAVPIQEAYRVLKKGGAFVFSVTHPAWDLYVYAQQKVGVDSGKIQGLGNYFRRGFADFMMGGNNNSNPKLKYKYKKVFAVEHYQRPVSDYFNQLTSVKFIVRRLEEPEITNELLQKVPGYVAQNDHPMGLIFFAIK